MILRKKTIVKLSVIALVFLFLTLFNSNHIKAETPSPVQNSMNKSVKLLSSYIPILIDSNDDFVTYGFNGSGTAIDPYRIEYLNITASEYYAIEIRDVSKYFRIQHCYLDAENTGIYLNNNSFGMGVIYNNTCCNNDEQGIEVRESDGYLLNRNKCYNNSKNGILIDDSDYTQVSNNRCYNNTWDGIFFSWFLEYDSFHGIVDSNICYDNKLGIEIGGVNITVTNNTCYNNQIGMSLRTKSSLVNNNILSNNEEGAKFRCEALVIHNNTFSSNDNYGAYGYSKYSIFVYNTISENLNYGLHFDGWSRKNILYHNNFINNNLGGDSQAFDNGTRNKWFSKELKEGNFWNDSPTTDEYSISGDSKLMDKYPLNSLVDSLGDIPSIPKVPNFIGIFLGIFIPVGIIYTMLQLFLIVFIIRRIKRKKERKP